MKLVVENNSTRRVTEITAPIYMDVNTDKSEKLIKMDHMLYESIVCCSQLTLGFNSLNATCLAYDQLIPICPILLALSSSVQYTKAS